MKPCSGPLAGEPPTGEPDAGDPPVRFGGRGVTIQCDVPTPIKPLSLHRHSRAGGNPVKQYRRDNAHQLADALGRPRCEFGCELELRFKWISG